LRTTPNTCPVYLVGLLTGWLLCGLAVAQSNAQPITQEYLIQQAADEALLIRIDAYEAEFNSRIRGEEGEGILYSGIANSRIAPVFQYVTPPDSPRQLGIEVSSQKYTNRSEFDLQLTRVTVWDERSNAVSHAYQMLSFGMQTPVGDSEADWTVRIDNLTNAGRLFQQYGMNEMRLWSRFLAAHLVHYQLHDYSISYRMSREILAELNVAHLPQLELAAWQLQGAALSGLKQSGALSVRAQNPDRVQRALAHTGQLAKSMGALHVQAQALDESGSEYASDGQFSEALARFQNAVEIADSVGDVELSKHSRESMLEIHAQQGDAPASSEVLQQIETQLTGQNAGDELALNLLAQARLFIRDYRYDKARDVLTQAVAFQNYSAIRKQLDFELARIAYQTGRPDDSLALLQRAGIGVHRQKRNNSILDNGQALSLLASVHRSRGEIAEMREARRTQGLYDRGHDHYLYQRGLDELAAGRADQQAASRHFRQSFTAAYQVGNHELRDLALLQYCSLNSDWQCSRVNIDSSYQRQLSGGIPRHAAEAMYLYARILVRNGQREQAINTMHTLVDRIHFLRNTLPGVLGAWYQEQHESLFGFFIDLLVTGARREDSANETRSLLALSKIRLIGRYDSADPNPDSDSKELQSLRALLAERSVAPTGVATRKLAGDINQRLDGLQEPFKAQFAHLSEGGIKAYLDNLANHEMLLSYHVSEHTAQVWVAHKGIVTQRVITNPASVYRQLRQAHNTLPAAGEAEFRDTMDQLGARLLDPVADLLTRKIYWIPAGPLLGLPLDAIRLKGHYLAEKHDVVNLLSFPARPGPAAALQTGSIDTVFLAGNPQDYSGSYANSFDTTDEIRTIMDIFVGPGLRTVQGAALLPDEFQDQRFGQANLAHLAMPGVIDLHDPARSSLELSGSEDGPRRTRYQLEGIGPGSLSSRLVLLSSTRTTGTPVSAFASKVGLVEGFTRAGTHTVIVDLWANSGKADEGFLVDFYRELQDTSDIAESLQYAKRRYLKNNHGTGLYGWAGYQLFIR